MTNSPSDRRSLRELRPVSISGVWVDLEPLTEDHAAEMVLVGADAAIWTYMARGPFVSEQDARNEVLELHRRGVPFAIRTSDGRFAGCIVYLNVEPTNESVEIGWVWVGTQFQGELVAAEAQYRLMAHVFDAFVCGRVWLKTDARNPRSQASLERFGLVREGVLRRHQYVKDGYIRDSAVYSLLGEEWPDFRARVEQFMAAVAQPAGHGVRSDWRSQVQPHFSERSTSG